MQKKSLVVLYILFLFWGVIFCMNDILLPYLKKSFTLSYLQASMIQFTFFGVYLVVSIPAGKVVSHYGYKKGIVIGLLISAIGCLLFYPASQFKVYGIFLFALFVLSSGITFLQVSANPFIAVLGNPSQAASRLNLAQAVSKLGYAVAPIIGAYFLFRQIDVNTEANASMAQIPYLIFAAVLFLLSLLVFVFPFPTISVSDEPFLKSWRLLKKRKRLMLGAVAIFAYVGAEITTNAFFISFLSDSTVSGVSLTEAASYLTNYWMLATVTGFVGFIVLKYIDSEKLLLGCGVISMLLLLVCIMASGKIVIVSLVLLGGFISIMFPTIFALAIEGLGDFTSQGSAILLTAVVGGALIPPVQGWLADTFNIRISFVIPLICYLYVTCYGFWLTRQKSRLASLFK
jgi:MFS transporter, FHS family, L-fucose permease